MADKVVNSGIMYNMLASGSKMKGDFMADSDFRIDGNFEGTITCKGKVVVGPNGFVKGTLVCANAEIMGTIEGSINVSELLSLKSTAKVNGDVKTKVLMIEPKAFFTGTCDMKQEMPKVEK